jgi:formate dehydrogenase assembly factor FdhD
MKRSCHRSGVASVAVERVHGVDSEPASDELSVEEPLEIRIAVGRSSPPKSVAVTMRTTEK